MGLVETTEVPAVIDHESTHRRTSRTLYQPLGTEFFEAEEFERLHRWAVVEAGVEQGVQEGVASSGEEGISYHLGAPGGSSIAP